MSENDFEEGGDGSSEAKFIEVDGKKFVDDGSGEAKMDDSGNPIPFVDKKFIETPEARAARLKKQTEQHKEKYPHLYEEEPKGKKKEDKKSDDLDYGQKAYLIAKGIDDADEVTAVKTAMANSGKSLEEVLNSSWFKAELKEMREDKETSAAIPGKGNRTGASASNTVEYWIAKGELPPNNSENAKLRQDVVNARMKKEKAGNVFTNNPVIGG